MQTVIDLLNKKILDAKHHIQCNNEDIELINGRIDGHYREIADYEKKNAEIEKTIPPLVEAVKSLQDLSTPISIV